MAITCRFNSIASYRQSLILQPILDTQKNNIYILWMKKNVASRISKMHFRINEYLIEHVWKKKFKMFGMKSEKCSKQKSKMSIKCP